MSSIPISARTTARARALILFLAPAVMMIGGIYHPWLGNHADPDFLARLAAAVTEEPGRWAISHLTIALGSGLIVLAFIALRGFLRDAGENRWSALGLPLIVLGSFAYAMLPAMEFAPLAAAAAGADVAAVQHALMSNFAPILLTSALLFTLGIAGFALGILRSSAFDSGLTLVVVAALVIMGVSRFFPVGVAQLYVGPAAGIVALWTLAYGLLSRPEVARRRDRAEPLPVA